MRRNRRLEVEVDTKRHLVAALPHRDLYLLATAAETFQSVLGHLDGIHPDPEVRDEAVRLGTLARLLREANMIRDYVEDN
jgi:hypothetical protein